MAPYANNRKYRCAQVGHTIAWWVYSQLNFLIFKIFVSLICYINWCMHQLIKLWSPLNILVIKNIVRNIPRERAEFKTSNSLKDPDEDKVGCVDVLNDCTRTQYWFSTIYTFAKYFAGFYTHERWHGDQIQICKYPTVDFTVVFWWL